MLNLKPNDCAKRNMESEVIKVLREQECTLNTVNNYGENLLHISAANGCFEITKEILKNEKVPRIIDRKNKFGWTSLMLAIRNRDINTVKLLIEKKANINESTYLGMSVLGLTAAINKDMFETVYKACPSSLLNTTNDDITPLCIAAMKNDKDLFFRLLDLGFELSKANKYTQIMMRQSTVPEIRNLGEKQLDIDDYWNDTSDNISVESDTEEQSICSTETPIFKCLHVDSINNNIEKKPVKKDAKYNMQLLDVRVLPHNESLISPTLTYNIDEMFPTSPQLCVVQKNCDDKSEINKKGDTQNKYSMQNKITVSHSEFNTTVDVDSIVDTTPIVLQRLQSIRPSNLEIQSSQDDLNTTLGYIPDFSPLRSPNVPADINDENVFGENTPTPPRYKTPPRGMILNSEEVKMFTLLNRYGLSRLTPIFLEQEVDIDLFMTLTDTDLIEIGIKSKSDRKEILAAISDHQRIEI